MRLRKCALIPILLVVLLAAGAAFSLWYRNRPSVRARRLVAELRETAVAAPTTQPASRFTNWLVKLGLMKPRGDRDQIIARLAAIGAPAVPLLIVVLKDEGASLSEQTDAIDALEAIGELAVPPLIRATHALPAPWMAACAIETIERRDGTALPHILHALDGNDDEVRCGAAYAVIYIYRAAKPAAPGLIRALNDDNRVLRHRAACALSRVDTPAAGRLAVPALVDALHTDKDPFIRYFAGMAFRDLGSAGEPAIPALVKALDDEDYNVGRQAVLALGELGPAAKHTLPDLLALFEKANSYVREAIVRVLYRWAGDNDQMWDLADRMNERVNENLAQEMTRPAEK